MSLHCSPEHQGTESAREGAIVNHGTTDGLIIRYSMLENSFFRVYYGFSKRLMLKSTKKFLSLDIYRCVHVILHHQGCIIKGRTSPRFMDAPKNTNPSHTGTSNLRRPQADYETHFGFVPSHLFTLKLPSYFAFSRRPLYFIQRFISNLAVLFLQAVYPN